MEKSFVGAHWDQYDIDPITLFDQTTMLIDGEELTNPAMGFHWTNFLRLCPQNNMDNLSSWIKYFRRQDEIFGNMLSRDVGFASNQAVYARFAKLSVEGNKYTIDLSDVDAQGALSLLDHFYVSTKAPIKQGSCVGGNFSIYDKKTWHTNYKIERINNAKIITFELV